MPAAKETRAHQMVTEKNRMNKSISGISGSGQVSPGSFKMRRFKDIKGKISTNRALVVNRHAYLASPDAQTGPEEF